METVADFILFSWCLKSLWMVTAAMKLKDTCSSEDKLWHFRQHIKKQRHHFANKGLSSQSYGRNINNLKYADDTTLIAESEAELKSLLMKVKEEREKAGLKPNIQKTKIMSSGPITSWDIDGETVEMWQTLFSWAVESLKMVTAAMK